MTLDPELVQDLLLTLDGALPVHREPPGRQPVHVVYGGAHLFTAATPRKLGDIALRYVDAYAPDAAALTDAFGLDPTLAAAVHPRLVQKLRQEPVEDYRVDFEDGFGVRGDAAEDDAAEHTARETAVAFANGTLPPFFGIRVKALDDTTRHRAVRTLDRYLTTLVRVTGELPERFVVTLPKVTVPDQVTTLARLLTALERGLSLPANHIGIELMIEVPHALRHLPALVDAGHGRCRAVHFGAYDYTAALGIAAPEQRMDHPACDVARQHMLRMLAGHGVFLSDGATTTLPIAPKVDPRPAVHRAWRLAYDDTRRSLASGFYQGWDLHPGQLVSRYVANYAFFLAGAEAAHTRLHNFVREAAQATAVGEVFDDAATGRGLVNFFLRAHNCGALTEAEIGLPIDALRTRNFAVLSAACT